MASRARRSRPKWSQAGTIDIRVTLREARSVGVAPEDASLDLLRAHARELAVLFSGGEPDLEVIAYSRQVFGAGDGLR